MSSDRRDEVVAVERKELDIALCAHRCRARNVPQERDLTEVAARPRLADDTPVDDDLDVTLGDDVEAVADVTLPEELVARGEPDRAEHLRKTFLCRLRQRRKQLDAAEQLELPLRDRHRVQLGEPPAEKRGQDR